MSGIASVVKEIRTFRQHVLLKFLCVGEFDRLAKRSQISKGNNRLAPACRSLGAEPGSAGSRSIQNSTPANSLTVKSCVNNWPLRNFARFPFGQAAIR
jgi:hypothetical protein